MTIYLSIAQPSPPPNQIAPDTSIRHAVELPDELASAQRTWSAMMVTFLPLATMPLDRMVTFKAYGGCGGNI